MLLGNPPAKGPLGRYLGDTPPSITVSLSLPGQKMKWWPFLSTRQSLAICYGVKPNRPMGLSLSLWKRNLKPLLLTNLKVHKLESLCSQIWPQYKQITKTSGLSSGLLISIFYQISLTSSNGMANGRRSPIFKPSGTLEAVFLSARTVLPIKSSSALSPSLLQKDPNLKPL